MKFAFPTDRRSAFPKSAFTLVEIMVAMSLFIMVIGGILFSHIIGIKMYEVTKAKLGASDQARQTIGILLDEVRSAKKIRVGEGGKLYFTEAPPGTPQQGNAIQLHPDTNYNQFVRYYLDPYLNCLKRVSNIDSDERLIAEHITNSVVFTSEDFQGNLLTDNQNNRVIGLNLEFYQIQYPVMPIGEDHYFEFYQLRTKITRRTLE